MLKFLRKHNKWILVVGGVLLMVAWLLPGTLQRIGNQQNNRVIAKADGRSVTLLQVAQAANDMAIASDALMGIDFERAGIEGPTHWLLLAREARQCGFLGGSALGDALIDRIAEQVTNQQMQRVPPEQQTAETRTQFLNFLRTGMHERRAALAARHGAPAVDHALASFWGIDEMRRAYAGASRISEPQAIAEARDVQNQADVDYVVLRADEMPDQPAPADEAALQAHFEKFRAVKPGDGELGFGYLRPDAIKIEWLTLERQKLQDAVTLDPIEVNKRWKSARDKYPGEFADEKKNVENAMRADALALAVREADQIIRAEIAQERRKFPEAGRWRAIPPDWRQNATPLPRIAAAVADKLASRLASRVEPAIGALGAWTSADDLRSLPAMIGRAEIAVGARKVALADAFSEIKEIGGDQARGPQVGLLWEQGAADPSGNLHYFRILDARAEGPPPSLDDARELVIADVRRLRAFEALEARVSEIQEAALAGGGVGSLSARFPGAEARPGFVSRYRSFLQPAALDAPELREKVMALHARLDPTKPVADAPLTDRVAVLAVKPAFAVVALEIKGVKVLTKEEADSSLLDIAQYARMMREEPPIDNPFSWKRMQERHAYAEVGAEREAKDQAAAASPAAPTP